MFKKFHLDTRTPVVLPRNKPNAAIQLLIPADVQHSGILYTVRPILANTFFIQRLNHILAKPTITRKDRVVHTDRGSWEEFSPLDALEDALEEMYPLGLARDLFLIVTPVCNSAQIQLLCRLTGAYILMSLCKRRDGKTSECNLPWSTPAGSSLHKVLPGNNPADDNSLHSKKTIPSCSVADLFVMEQSYQLPCAKFDKFRHNLNTIIIIAADIHTLAAYAII
jgi:hypothetical protein